MTEYIEKNALYKKVAELEELANKSNQCQLSTLSP